MKKVLLFLMLSTTFFSYAITEKVGYETKIDYGTCTYTITEISSEGVTETTYQTETRTEEECRMVAESHAQYLRTMESLEP